ncbi:HAD-IB family phosphatase [Luteolibacter sp. GHJ8]|uniref:phosphoserine phosphatase n=1 Tax=Luteolibacter rhizosphaerae TaxID=2989719 RepID=A0ABT3G3A1_9BACT|nr:HAD-IB family phosphatase [Luteolibacter rhizosphaerae]MCW1913966.1 HAD-IB family phosphatase [Luteolibacter rhizosphaerae]
MNDLRLEVSIDDQTLTVFRGHELVKIFTVSTAAKGVGFTPGSYRTPTGRFVIAQKIGETAASGTVFVSREPVGTWQPGESPEKDLVLTRILRLSGLEPENANSFDRFIYIHGTNQEAKLGSPASCGCIRLSNADVIELFDMVEPGMIVEVLPPLRKRGKLAFFDCDSTLSTIEGIDELGRARGPEVFKLVEHLTHQAMNGEVPIGEVFGRRMEIIRPDQATADAVARLYVDTIVPGAAEMIARLKAEGWTPVILSGGFEPLIRPLARVLGVDHVEAVPLHFSPGGDYAGYGADYPTTRNGGKPEIIREWKQAMLPEAVIMMGDGISDLEAKNEVDLFIGFGGVVSRPAVEKGADAWITRLSEIANVVLPD